MKKHALNWEKKIHKSQHFSINCTNYFVREGTGWEYVTVCMSKYPRKGWKTWNLLTICLISLVPYCWIIEIFCLVEKRGFFSTCLHRRAEINDVSIRLGHILPCYGIYFWSSDRYVGSQKTNKEDKQRIILSWFPL